LRDIPNGVLLLVRLVLSGAFAALATWIGWMLGGKPWALIGFLVAVPVIGVAIAKPLVELIHEGFGWLSAQPLRKWQGNYYEFGGVQVRVFEEDGALWFAAPDVVMATGVKAIPATIPGGREIAEMNALPIGVIETLLTAHEGHEARRFLLWARREVITPWERKRSGALVPR
jgi:hypothetical protein